MSNSTRPSSSYDERFVVPLEASRRGAHRARVSPIMATLPVIAVVGVVIGAVALVYAFLGGMGGSGADVAPTTSASPTAAATSTPTSSADSTDGASATSSATVDKSLVVAVYNGTSPTVSGLARKAGAKLTTAGWTLGPVETWTGTPVTATTVYYGSAEQRATAQAVAKALGRGVVKLSPANAKSGITVVVGNDYPGAGGHATTTKPSAGSTRSHATASSSPHPSSPAGESGTPVN